LRLEFSPLDKLLFIKFCKNNLLQLIFLTVNLLNLQFKSLLSMNFQSEIPHFLIIIGVLYLLKFKELTNKVVKINKINL
jgi:hypothetical protein